MKLKKIASLLLAVMMVCMLAVPAMAMEMDGDAPDPTPGDDQVRLLYMMAKNMGPYYNVGDTFDTSDFQVIAYYYNGHDWNSMLQKDITADVVDQLEGIVFEYPGRQEIYFTYTENGVTVENNLFVQVVDPNSNDYQLFCLGFENWPRRIYVGEGLDLSGLTVKAIYEKEWSPRTDKDVTEEFKAQIAEQGITQGMTFEEEGLHTFSITFNKDGEQVAMRVDFDVYARN